MLENSFLNYCFYAVFLQISTIPHRFRGKTAPEPGQASNTSRCVKAQMTSPSPPAASRNASRLLKI
jgi:hypothetical protein